MTDLTLTINHLYAEFAGYSIPTKLDTSPAHKDKMFLQELSGSPLRKMSQDQLGSYAASALTTVGGAEDYKYFLPRILELSVEGAEWPGLVPDLIATKLLYGKWRSWPVPEQRAIEAVYADALKWSIHQDPAIYDAVPWLTGAALLDLDLAGTCAELLEAGSSNAALQLSSFIQSESKGIWKGSGRWENCPSERRGTIKAWLFGEDLSSTLTQFMNAVCHNDRWQIEAAVNQLSNVRI